MRSPHTCRTEYECVKTDDHHKDRMPANKKRAKAKAAAKKKRADRVQKKAKAGKRSR